MCVACKHMCVACKHMYSRQKSRVECSTHDVGISVRVAHAHKYMHTYKNFSNCKQNEGESKCGGLL